MSLAHTRMLAGCGASAVFRFDCHYHACQLVEFLVTEAMWFEFCPDDNDTYLVAVEMRVRTVVVSQLNRWHIPVETVDE